MSAKHEKEKVKLDRETFLVEQKGVWSVRSGSALLTKQKQEREGFS
jgi:hypothetical protein